MNGDGEDAHSLSLSAINGPAEPGATTTIEVLNDSEPVKGASVTVNGEDAGTTDADGTLEITLPNENAIDLRAEYQDADARLDFDFETEDTDETTIEETAASA